jgi:predicted methyltransferase
MLNREASSPKNKPVEIIEHLNIYNGNVVGDIGSGGGFFTREFSREVARARSMPLTPIKNLSIT